jgi:ribosomal protein S18 acetylase RimI-like enzyme
LYELEAEAAGTGYIHVLATVPSMKGRGVASRLLEFAESRHRGPHGMSMVLSEVNAAARGLCERHCYRVTARREMETDGWSGAGGALLLLVKPG